MRLAKLIALTLLLSYVGFVTGDAQVLCFGADGHAGFEAAAADHHPVGGVPPHHDAGIETPGAPDHGACLDVVLVSAAGSKLAKDLIGGDVAFVAAATPGSILTVAASRAGGMPPGSAVADYLGSSCLGSTVLRI